MISQEAIEKVLGIKETVPLRPEDMLSYLKITWYPFDRTKLNPNIIGFSDKLRDALVKLGVEILPYEKTLVYVPLSYRLKKVFLILINNFISWWQSIFSFTSKREYISYSAITRMLQPHKIRRGISVIALGENKSGNLPKDKTQSFTENMVTTIVDMPEGIDEKTDFQKHFDASMRLFSHHMTNLVIGVNETQWILYNFNASHPIYPMQEGLEKALLYGFIPKLVAPIRPNKFREFVVKSETFRFDDPYYRPFVADLVECGKALADTGLYPRGKKLDDLSWRNGFYKWVGKLHLDHRNGMSYGFLAWQLPVVVPKLMSVKEFEELYGSIADTKKDYVVDTSGRFHLKLELRGEQFYFLVPDVWVLSQRSGSDKTKFNPSKDLVKMGLCSGKMHLETPVGTHLNQDYKPSFDTRVILAHSIGNVLVAAIDRFTKGKSQFADRLEKNGISISHWHGYINPDHIPSGWFVHGIDNPHVSCSSPQSAIYAFSGKLDVYMRTILDGKEFLGDIHVEPHHGTNICFTSLVDFSKFVGQGSNIARLGNYYLSKYQSTVHIF